MDAAFARSSQVLIRQLLAGGETAAARLVAQHRERLAAIVRARMSRKVARRVDPEDVVQSAFAVLFVMLRRERYKPGSALDMWKLLVTITLNKTRQQERFHRARRRTVAREADAESASALMAASCPRDSLPKSPAEIAELEDRLTWLLASLPPEDRPILELRLKGHSTQDIADQTCRAERSVRRVLERVRDRLLRAAGNGQTWP
jgi:RNA polymerase sigma-70 factor (ECF subfamily)